MSKNSCMVLRLVSMRRSLFIEAKSNHMESEKDSKTDLSNLFPSRESVVAMMSAIEEFGVGQQAEHGTRSAASSGLPDLITWKEFSKIEFPQQKWLIERLIPREGIVIIASPSGEKKTWLAMSMATSIANGTDFLQHSDFKAHEGTVLYIDQEMSQTELQRRGNLLGLPNTKNPIYLGRGGNLDFSKEEHIEDLFATIARYEVKVVFIDTLRAVAGGLKEDKAEEVRQFLDRFKSLKDQGVALVFLDHCRKPALREGNTPKKEQLLGSQDKVASIESLIMLRSNERNEEILVHHLKSRSSIEYKPFRVEMRDEVDEQLNPIKVTLTYGGGIEEKEYKIDEAKNIIISMLQETSLSRKELIERLQMESEIGEKNTSGALKELKAAGKVSVKKRNKENIYSLVRQEDEVFEDHESSTDNMFESL